MSEITVLIADDEPPARRRMRAILADHAGVRVVGECGSGRDAIAFIREHRPHLVFLDVQMPEGDGFDVVEAIGASEMPVVVFVTAYDEYALRAFEAHALDYLLKPYDRERFEAALDRARLHVQRVRAEGEDARLLSLLHALHGGATLPDRLAVRSGTRMRLVEVETMDYLQAETNYVRIHAAGQSYLIRGTLAALEAKLDPQRFLRVHRSLIVNLTRIAEVESLFAGEYILFLHDGTRLTTGRTYRAAVQKALGLRA